jgi:hypothetical protein
MIVRRMRQAGDLTQCLKIDRSLPVIAFHRLTDDLIEFQRPVISLVIGASRPQVMHDIAATHNQYAFIP